MKHKMTEVYSKAKRKICYLSLRHFIVRVFPVTLVILIVYNSGVISAVTQYFRSIIEEIIRENSLRFLCMKFQGGLGNLLFQYAFAYAVSKANNMTMFCTHDDVKTLKEIFYIPDCEPHSRGNRACRKLQPKSSEFDCGFDENILKFNRSDILFEGYFQSWMYWKEDEHILRNYFTIKDEVMTESNELMASALSQLGYARHNVSLVGIHIRRGDILKKEYLIKFGYQAPDAGYLKRAMEYIRSKVNGTIVYIVCSNDMQWTREVLDDPNTVFMIGRSRNIDFSLLASCDHLIMTVGTFGWWIGWSIKGIVVYYEKPFKNGTDLQKKFTKDYRTTFYYPHWVGIS